MSLKEVSKVKMFGGWQKVFSHMSSELKCPMNFAIFLPEQTEKTKVPALYYLSGLTCTEQNVTTKAGAQRFAAQHGIAFVCPDTSPRGCDIEGEEDSWDFGTGAGFYVDATEKPWNENYRMYSYVTKELPALVNANFNVDGSRIGITGHSMGGHGALVCFLKNPGMYKSVSAFAPICNPINCDWGKKAFGGYLGPNTDSWKEYDACELVRKYKGPGCKILADQGADDGFLPKGQLLPDNLVKACNEAKVPVEMRMQPGYDHSYYFIATFMEDHFKHHADALLA